MKYTQDLYGKARLKLKKVNAYFNDYFPFPLNFIILTQHETQAKAQLEAVHVEMNEAKNKSSLVGTALCTCRTVTVQLLFFCSNVRMLCCLVTMGDEAKSFTFH